MSEEPSKTKKNTTGGNTHCKLTTKRNFLFVTFYPIISCYQTLQWCRGLLGFVGICRNLHLQESRKTAVVIFRIRQNLFGICPWRCFGRGWGRKGLVDLDVVGLGARRKLDKWLCLKCPLLPPHFVIGTPKYRESVVDAQGGGSWSSCVSRTKVGGTRPRR